MEIQVEIVKVLEARRFTSKTSGNEFAICPFVGKTLDAQYPKEICFETFGEDKFKEYGIVVGKTYNISFDIESREYKGNYYTTLRTWKVVSLEQVTPQAPIQTQSAPIPQQAAQPTTIKEVALQKAQEVPQASASDDLPF